MSLFHGALTLGQATTGAPQGGNSLITFLPFLFIMGALYFLMIAPQRKKQKEHDKMLAALRSGDEVITNGGIYGTITNVKDDRFVVRVSETTKLEVAKGFIQSVVRKADSESK